MACESPFACDLSALSSEERERHRTLVRKLGGAVAARREDPDGYSLRIDRERMALAELGEWIALESRCCPFFDFRISLAREGGELWVSLAGRAGAKEFIRAEFDM
jgi:hypothetical protein